MLRIPARLFLLTFLVSCGNGTDASTIGGPSAYTSSPIAAIVNGRVWAGASGRGDTIADLFAIPPTFEIGATDSSHLASTHQVTVLGVVIHVLNGPRTYAIGGFNDEAYATYAVLDSTGYPIAYYKSGGDQLGRITIATLDTINHSLSGTFEFEARASASAVVVATRGRFSAHYIPL